MSHFKRLIIRAPKYIWYLFCLVIFYPIGRIAKVLFPKYRGVWIVSERGSDARDNGYHFFKYIRENHPEIKVCSKTLYMYIESGIFQDYGINNFSLRR